MDVELRSPALEHITQRLELGSDAVMFTSELFLFDRRRHFRFREPGTVRNRISHTRFPERKHVYAYTRSRLYSCKYAASPVGKGTHAMNTHSNTHTVYSFNTNLVQHNCARPNLIQVLQANERTRVMVNVQAAIECQGRLFYAAS